MLELDDGMIGVNLEKIAYDSPFSSVTKLLAIRLMKEPYITLGKFFQSLSDTDVQFLSNLASAAVIKSGDMPAEIGDEDALLEITMLCHMLSHAEGTYTGNINECIENIGFLVGLISSASLERKGLCEVVWKNASFGREFLDSTLVIPKVS